MFFETQYSINKNKTQAYKQHVYLSLAFNDVLPINEQNSSVFYVFEEDIFVYLGTN